MREQSVCTLREEQNILFISIWRDKEIVYLGSQVNEVVNMLVEIQLDKIILLAFVSVRNRLGDHLKDISIRIP